VRAILTAKVVHLKKWPNLACTQFYVMTCNDVKYQDLRRIVRESFFFTLFALRNFVATTMMPSNQELPVHKEDGAKSAASEAGTWLLLKAA
jgi:hypothetical protein